MTAAVFLCPGRVSHTMNAGGRLHRSQRAAVYAWTLHDRLLAIPMSLRTGDDDVMLDLQATFDTVCSRARYDLSVNYQAELDPPPSAAIAEWIRERTSAC